MYLPTKDLGVPIPVFYEKNGQEILLNKETISHIADLFSVHGADIWWEYEVSELLPPSYLNQADRWQKVLILWMFGLTLALVGLQLFLRKKI